MTGLLLIFVFGVWFMVAKWIASKIVADINSPKAKKVAKPLILVLLMLAPLADEVMGGVQFYALCSKEAVLKVDEEKARNKIVISQGASNEYLTGYMLPIGKQYWSYKDIDTGEILVSWNEFRAKGGIFIRTLGISETDSPILFSGVCYPEGSGSPVFKKLNISK